MQTCTRVHTRGQRKAQEISSGGGGSEKSRSLELLSKIVAIDSATFDSAKAANKGLASVCPRVASLARCLRALHQPLVPSRRCRHCVVFVDGVAIDNRTVGSLQRSCDEEHLTRYLLFEATLPPPTSTPAMTCGSLGALEPCVIPCSAQLSHSRPPHPPSHPMPLCHRRYHSTRETTRRSGTSRRKSSKAARPRRPMEGKSLSSGKKQHRTGCSFGVLVLANEFVSDCCVCSVSRPPSQ